MYSFGFNSENSLCVDQCSAILHPDVFKGSLAQGLEIYDIFNAVEIPRVRFASLIINF